MNISNYLQEAGSAAKLAREINVAPALVSQWRTGLRQVPAERCPDIERATGGQVTCEELRPDLADKWAYLRGTRPRCNRPDCKGCTKACEERRVAERRKVDDPAGILPKKRAADMARRDEAA